MFAAVNPIFLHAAISSYFILGVLTEEAPTSFDCFRKNLKSLRRSNNENFPEALNTIGDVEEEAISFIDLTEEEFKKIVPQYIVDLEGFLQQLEEMENAPELQNHVGTLKMHEENIRESIRMLKKAVRKSRRGLAAVLANAVEKSVEMVEGAFKAVKDITVDLTSRTVQSGVDLMEGVATASKTLVYGVKSSEEGEEDEEEEDEDGEEEEEKKREHKKGSRIRMRKKKKKQRLERR